MQALLVSWMSAAMNDKLLTLLALQRSAQEAPSEAELLHIIVNESMKVIPYDRAVFCRFDNNKPQAALVSGNAVLEKDGPFAQEISAQIMRDFAPHTATDSVLVAADQKTALLAFRRGPDDGVQSCLLLERAKPFIEAELHILGELCVTYTRSLQYFAVKEHGILCRLKDSVSGWRLLGFAALAVLFFMPVQQSVTAPAEIIAKDAYTVSAPFNGVLSHIDVSPGEAVSAQQPLARMDTIALSAKLNTAQQEMHSLQARLSRLKREVLSNPDKRAEMIRTEMDLNIQEIELTYAQEQMARSTITSPFDGVAVFSDKQALQGVSVQTGQVLMRIADPAKLELLVRVPVHSMIPLGVGTPVRFFLNVAPLSGYDGSITAMGYRPSADADGLMSYKIYAAFAHDPDHDVRIGWKGTAKLYGQKTILGYALLRKPLIFLRDLTGL